MKTGVEVVTMSKTRATPASKDYARASNIADKNDDMDMPKINTDEEDISEIVKPNYPLTETEAEVP